MTRERQVRSTEEALKLALEALEKSHTCPLLPDDCAETITAIKEALMSGTDVAQQEQEYQGSDTAKAAHMMDLYEALGVKWGDDPFRVIAKLRGTQPEQLMSDQIKYGMSITQGGKRIDPMSIYKEPEQEPVAEVDDWRDSIFTRYVEYLPSGTRLYTTPLEPKPMTDEEIDKMCPKFEDPMRREMWMIGFKAAHGIKGEA